jgi:TRIAD3 protein (E3 ubiquitin-protein ligase RNF216)
MAQNFAQAAAVAVPLVAEERGQLKVYYPSAGDSPNHYPRGPGPNNEVISLVDISDEEDDSSQAQRRRRRRRNKRLRDPFMNQLQEAVARGGRRVKPAYPDGSYNVLGGNMEPFDPSRFKSDPNERDNAPDPVVPKLPPAISTAEAEVLSVFGDIEISHLKLLLSQNSYRPDAVVSLLLDAPSYPRAQETTSQAPAGSSLLKLDDSPEWTYDFTSPTSFAAYPKTPYTIEAVQLLLNLLPLGAINPVRAMLRNCSWHYAICHDRIITALKSGTDDELEQYRQVKQVLEDGTFQRPDQKQALALLAGICLGKCFIRSRRAPKSVVVTDPTLLEECQYVDRKLQEYLSTMKVRSERERRKQEADLMGVSLECSCCFDTYAYEDMIACITKGHLFCLECLDTYGKNKMWGDGNFGTDKTKKPLLDLLCFHGDGCSSSFDRRSLEKAMEPKNFKKYDELQCQLVVDQVLGDELASCPKCNYQAAVPTGQNIFSCPVQGCRFESCRGCGEAAHIPLR